jgi:hypothetical protein
MHIDKARAALMGARSVWYMQLCRLVLIGLHICSMRLLCWRVLCTGAGVRSHFGSRLYCQQCMQGVRFVSLF